MEREMEPEDQNPSFQSKDSTEESDIKQEPHSNGSESKSDGKHSPPHHVDKGKGVLPQADHHSDEDSNNEDDVGGTNIDNNNGLYDGMFLFS